MKFRHAKITTHVPKRQNNSNKESYPRFPASALEASLNPHISSKLITPGILQSPTLAEGAEKSGVPAQKRLERGVQHAATVSDIQHRDELMFPRHGEESKNLISDYA